MCNVISWGSNTFGYFFFKCLEHDCDFRTQTRDVPETCPRGERIESARKKIEKGDDSICFYCGFPKYEFGVRNCCEAGVAEEQEEIEVEDEPPPEYIEPQSHTGE